MKRLAAILALCLSVPAFAASCIGGPAISADKDLHFAGTAAISAGVSALTQNADIGFWAGILAGAARELYKETHGMRCEYSSMAYDLAGAAAGSYAIQHWFIAPKRDGIELFYTRRFR